jgi:hypothetical protein
MGWCWGLRAGVRPDEFGWWVGCGLLPQRGGWDWSTTAASMISRRMGRFCAVLAQGPICALGSWIMENGGQRPDPRLRATKIHS